MLTKAKEDRVLAASAAEKRKAEATQLAPTAAPKPRKTLTQLLALRVFKGMKSMRACVKGLETGTIAVANAMGEGETPLTTIDLATAAAKWRDNEYKPLLALASLALDQLYARRARKERLSMPDAAR